MSTFNYPQTCLENHFLVSMPQLDDSNFKQSVILICKHNSEGAMGVVINKLTEQIAGDIFAQLHIEVSNYDQVLSPVFDGGPVHPELGLIIHDGIAQDWESSINIGEQLKLTSSKDILDAMANGKSPENAMICLGYAGWSPGQLENEIQDNAWFTVPVDHAILFSSEVDNKWQMSAQILGIDTAQFSHQVGHA